MLLSAQRLGIWHQPNVYSQEQNQVIYAGIIYPGVRNCFKINLHGCYIRGSCYHVQAIWIEDNKILLSKSYFNLIPIIDLFFSWMIGGQSLGYKFTGVF